MSNVQLRVGIKYCGHCNPQRDGQELVNRLKKRLPKMELVSWQQDYDVILIISACPAECVSQPALKGPVIKVAVDVLREWAIPLGHPAEDLLEACLEEGLRNLS